VKPLQSAYFSKHAWFLIKPEKYQELTINNFSRLLPWIVLPAQHPKKDYFHMTSNTKINAPMAAATTITAMGLI
jgi:hypothetical protein